MTDQPQTIAIDGPAASGKSTVGQRVAARLGFLYFDTGAMYRALTFLALERGLDLADGTELGALAGAITIEIEPPAAEEQDDRQYTVRVEGRDITWNIRHRLVDRHVSQVSAHSAVRVALLRQQRRIGLRGKAVLVGRDIGTVVMPDAPLKIYLDAPLDERVRRRYQECLERGIEVEYDSLLVAMRERDHYDSSREHSPLQPAEDAYLINSSNLSISEVVDLVLRLAKTTLQSENHMTVG